VRDGVCSGGSRAGRSSYKEMGFGFQKPGAICDVFHNIVTLPAYIVGFEQGGLWLGCIGCSVFFIAHGMLWAEGSNFTCLPIGLRLSAANALL